MNISTIAFILMAVFSVGVLMLVAGGLLVRSDLHRATLVTAGALYPSSRVLEDLRPVRDLVLDFIAESHPSRELLDFLRVQTKPVSIIELHANLPFRAEKLWTAVFITGAAGLIRFGSAGMTINDAGRAVAARLGSASFAKTESAIPTQLEQPAALGPLTAAEISFKPAISAADHQELSAAIAASKKLAVLGEETRPLQGKLMEARIKRATDIPPDLITMNARAELVDLDTRERVDLALVYPVDADIANGRISVFHPLGAAMLGHRVGDEFEWPVPYGTRRFRVAGVQFQPEAAFAMAA